MRFNVRASGTNGRSLLDTAQSRAELDQEVAESTEVLGLPRITDVEVSREARTCLQNRGDAAHDHEIDAGFGQVA